MYTLLRLLFATLCVCSLASANICTNSAWKGLLCLTSDAPASAYCTSKLASTLTKTLTSTTSIAAETVTSVIIATSYITPATAVATVYSQPTVTVSTTTTITTYVSIATSTSTATVTLAARDTQWAPRGAKHASTCNTSAGLVSLSALTPTALHTACSCIGAVPTPSTLTSVVTVTQGATTAKTTVIESADVVLTLQLTTTIPVLPTATTTVSSVSTVTLAAPSFTLAWGPTAGCADIAAGHTTEDLASSVDEADAVVYCEAQCSNMSNCAAVLVQQMFADYGSVTPHWMCAYNTAALDVATDLQCGKAIDIWGTAQAFNAIGRGV